MLPHAKSTSLRWFLSKLRAWGVSSKILVCFIKICKVYFRLHRHQWRTIYSLFWSLVIIVLPLFLYFYLLRDLPMPSDLLTKQQAVSTRIMDRHGQLLFNIYEDENRTLLPISQIPPIVKQATIAIEDQDFYHHFGFAPIGILRATLANLRGESIQGGSTITQQLVKNRLLSSERTLQRKVKELVVSLLVEGTFSKDEILEMYLNTVSYGGAAYGIEEAAQKYFGKSAQDLSLAEAALLAGLPQAPSVYSPFASNPELAKMRQWEVLRRMTEDKYISQAEADVASQEELKFKTNSIDIKAPHFVMYVKELLAEKYGEDLVEQGGLQVRTSLDLDLQEQSQAAVTEELKKLARLNVNNGAALVTNPKTGEILVMVGSKDYFDFAHDGQVNVTLRPRQPGSSIKPITYALALEKGKTVTSLIQDTPITYKVLGSPAYSPKNYDGKYHGTVTLKQALASSYNIPAVKTLAELGINNMIDQAEEMGISTWQDRLRYGLSLTLGGGEVLMTDMAKAYGVFASGGYRTDLNPILEIKDARGEVIYQNDCYAENKNCPSTKVLDEKVAFLMSDILSSNPARSSAIGLYSVLNIKDQQVAVKTGTTNSMRDNWTIGYTSDRVVATWVGNNNNAPMSYVASGITGASPIWNKIMRLNLSEEDPHRFASPSGLVKVKVCAYANSLPCAGCATSEEYYVAGTEPKQACRAEWFAKKLENQPQQH